MERFNAKGTTSQMKINLQFFSLVEPDNVEGDSPGITGWVADEFCGIAPIGDTTGTAVTKIKEPT